ncbi:MAG: ribosomal subunit interface protein [Spirochaetae bacterium HGW-Spirochaetae-5]|nr:MAG: ribosomal subunit interface protein [Spirochaetae bacterium HGW-Spirochaetae-5]
MKIKITGRHIDVSDSLRDYAEKKISKLEKYFQQLIDIHLIFYVEKLDHAAELNITGDSVQFHAREKAADLYSALDLLVDKMETQIARFKEKIQSRKGQGAEFDFSYDFTSETGTDAVLTQVSNKPINNIEAFLQMRVDKKDFILFKKGVATVESDVDYANKNYAVIFKSGSVFKLVEVPFEENKGGEFNSGSLIEYELDVKDESASNPRIDFKKGASCQVVELTLDEAFDSFEKSEDVFMPFFNKETRFFNVLSRNGKRLEVLVPAF